MRNRQGKRGSAGGRKRLWFTVLLVAAEFLLLWMYWERKMYRIDMEISEFNQQMRQLKK